MSARPRPARPEAPPSPPRPTTLKAAVAIAAVEGLILAVSGAALLVVANGSGDWLQRRLDDYNRSHSATSFSVFQHAADVVGAGAIAVGLIVLLLAASALLYGGLSRMVLVGVEVAVIAAAGVGVIVSVISVAYAVLPIAVIALLLVPTTSRAFAAAADAQEEWRAS